MIEKFKRWYKRNEHTNTIFGLVLVGMGVLLGLAPYAPWSTLVLFLFIVWWLVRWIDIDH